MSTCLQDAINDKCFIYKTPIEWVYVRLNLGLFCLLCIVLRSRFESDGDILLRSEKNENVKIYRASTSCLPTPQMILSM